MGKWPLSLNKHFVLSGESTNIFPSYLDSLSILSCTQKIYTNQNRHHILAPDLFQQTAADFAKATK